MLSRITGLTVLGWLIQPGLAIAATSGMPWETPLEQVSSSMTGPVVTSIAAIAVAVTGVLFALAPEGGFARRAASIGLGLSIAVAAPSFVGTLFGNAEGAEPIVLEQVPVETHSTPIGKN